MHGLKRTRAFLFCLMAFTLSLAAPAVEVVDIVNSEGHVVIQLSFFETGDGQHGSTWNLDDEQKEAMIRAAQYWVDRLYPTGEPAAPVRFHVVGDDEQNNAGASPNVSYDAGAGVFRADSEWILAKDVDMAGSEYHGIMYMGKFDNGYSLEENSQQVGYNDERKGINLEAVAIHELGHALGMTGPLLIWDTTFSNNQIYQNGNWYFNGSQATLVYGDGQTRLIPMDNDSSQVQSHFGLKNGLMTHRYFRNYSGFMEVEMAAFNDMGYNIDLRNFFGRSIYTDGNTIENAQGYFARTADGSEYIDGVGNTASFGLGLHVFGDRNTVVQLADLLANGVGGAGIRSDGIRNTITVAPDVRVHANGENGVGVLISFGNGSHLINRGDIQATGTDGDAVRFDIGKNSVSDSINDYELYSYYASQFSDDQDKAAAAALNGALVDNFDVTGSIVGGRSAVYMSRNAHVASINIMDGAEITGDIISDYDSLGFIDKDDVKATDITFGRLADANGAATDDIDDDFDFTVAGGIYGDGTGTSDYTGRGVINLRIMGGRTVAAAGSDINVLDITVHSSAKFVIGGTVHVGGVFTTLEGGILGYMPGDNAVLVAEATDLHADTVLDITGVRSGTYTVLTSAETLDLNEFATVTVNGTFIQPDGTRYGYAWNSTDNDIVIELTVNNSTLAWNGGSGVWDGSTRHWTEPEVGLDSFAAGDAAVFDGGSGTVAASAGVDPSDMTVRNDADYTFTGNHITVAKGSSTITAAAGKLTITGAKAVFAEGFTASLLEVRDGALGVLADSRILGGATISNSTYQASLARGATLTVAGALDLSGTNTLDLDVFIAGEHSIITAGSFSGVNTFDNITLGGENLVTGNRYNYNWRSNAREIILELLINNVMLTWNGGSGEWDLGNKNWTGSGIGLDSFSAGDQARFYGTSGEINVAAGVDPADMLVLANADHTFTGEKIVVAKGDSNIASAAGSLVIAGAAAHFNSGFSASSLEVDSGVIGVLADSEVHGDALIADSTYRTNLTDGGELTVSGQLTMSGTNTLDVDVFTKGSFTIIDAGDISGKNVFDKVTVGGQALTSRQGVHWLSDESPGGNSVVVKLGAQNMTLLWKGGNGAWDGSSFNWYDGQGKAETFINGDHVVFNGSGGAVNVATALSPSDMTLSGGANYRFTGSRITVLPDSGELPYGSGTVTVREGSTARFDGGLTAKYLDVSSSTLDMTADISITHDAALNNSVLGYRVSADPDDSPTLGVGGTLTLSGHNVLNLDKFSNGAYVIADAYAYGGNQFFDEITIGGAQRLERQGATMDVVDGDLVLTLSADNVELRWDGQSTVWNNTDKSWTDGLGNKDGFIDGDKALFDGATGVIDVAAAYNPYAMTFANGAKHTFTGFAIDVKAGTSTFADADAGLLSISGGSQARFNSGFSADYLEVNGGQLGYGADSTVRQDATLTNAVLEVNTTESSSALLSVGGTLTVNGGSVNFSGLQRRGATYVFLQADELKVASALSLGSLSGDNDGALDYNDSYYWLRVAGTLEEYTSRAMSPRQVRAAEYLDRLSPELEMGDLNDIMALMDDMSEAETRRALDSLYGMVYGSLATASFQHTSRINHALSSQLRRSYSEGFTAAYACGECEPCGAGLDCAAGSWSEGSGGHFWASGLGYRDRVRGDGPGTYAYGQTMNSGILGLDFVMGCDARAGVFGSYGDGRLTVATLDEKARTREFMLGGYMMKDWNGGYVLAAAGVGINDNKVTRSLAPFGRNARSDFDSYTAMANIEAGLNFEGDGVLIQPFAGVQYAGLFQKSVGETGADSINLRIDKEIIQSVRSELGVRGEWVLKNYGRSSLSALGSAGWVHEWNRTAAGEYTARLQGSPMSSAGFKLMGYMPRNDWASVSAGLAYEKDNIRIQGEYNAALNGKHMLHGWHTGISVSW